MTTGRAQDLAIWLGAADVVSLLVDLSPLLEFDGYYVLEDLMNVNALRRKALRFVFADLLRRPRRLHTALERGFVLYTGALPRTSGRCQRSCCPAFPAWWKAFCPPLSVPRCGSVGTTIALVTAALLIGPFVGEVRTAAAGQDPGSALAEQLDERISRTDLSAGLSAKTGAPMTRAPSDTRRQ